MPRPTDMPIEITPTFSLPDDSITLRFIRAGGPGGQNVNKVASAVQLRFDPAHCPQLWPNALARLQRELDVLLRQIKDLDEGFGMQPLPFTE